MYLDLRRLREEQVVRESGSGVHVRPSLVEA
jgi:hypothetical protein